MKLQRLTESGLDEQSTLTLELDKREEKLRKETQVNVST